nr:uncharacterized protein LOC127305231 [Lolium perenne]
MHSRRFSSELWLYVGASPCNRPEIRRHRCELVTVEAREERQQLLCQEEMIERIVLLPSPVGAPSASRCSYGRSAVTIAVDKDRGSSLYMEEDSKGLRNGWASIFLAPRNIEEISCIYCSLPWLY